MKYIRTENGVYEVETPSKENNFLVETDTYILTTKGHLPYKKDIIAQADTIPELCDVFIVIEGEGKAIDDYHIVRKWYEAASKREWLNENGLSFIDDNDKVKGAIFTKNGWEYVAEMNNEGKLVLI